MNTCDNNNYVKTKAYVGSLKICSQTRACDPYDFYENQALSSSLKMSNKEGFKDFEAMTETNRLFHPVNLSFS